MLLTHTLEIQQKRAERRRALPANSWLVRHLIPEGATASLHLERAGDNHLTALNRRWLIFNSTSYAKIL